MGWIGKEPKYANFPRQTLTGNGTATYTLNIPGVNNGIIVVVGGVWQTPYTNYTVVGDQITFTGNVASGVDIEVLWLGQVPTTLDLGTIASQDANNVTITGGSITGITDLAVADGGTGASTLTGIIKGNGTSAFSAAVSGTDYAPATSGSSILKGNGSGGTTSAVAGTDYAGLSSNNTFTGTQTFRDNKFEVTDDADTTKKAVHSAGNISASTTRTFTYPDENGTFALIGVKQQVGHWPSQSLKPQTTTGCANLAWTESTTNKVMTGSLAFDASTQEYAQFSFKAPKSLGEASNFTAIIEWTEQTGATSHDCVWSVEMQAQGDGDTVDSSWGTAVTVTDTGTSGTRRFTDETSAITPGGTWAAGDEIIVRVSRVAANGSDTLNVDALLLGISLYATYEKSTEE